MIRSIKLKLVTAAFAFWACATAGECQASFVVSGTNPETGNTVSGQVDVVTASGSNLVLKVTNTSAAISSNGDVLTGILFTPSIGGSWALTSTNVQAGLIWNSKSDNVTRTAPEDWTGAWTSTFGVSPPAAGTVGAATTGFGGVFNAGTLGLGTGGNDYGVVSNGTYPQGGMGPGNPNQFPYADNVIELTFTLGGGGSVADVTLSNVSLLFGTSGDGIITEEEPPVVPEPASLAVWALLGVAGLCVAGRRMVN